MAGYTNTPTSRGSPKILRQRRVVRMSPLNGDAARKTKSSTRKTADLSPQEILERNAKERERVHAVNDQYQVSGKPHNALCFMSLQVKCYGIFTLSDSDSDFNPMATLHHAEVFTLHGQIQIPILIVNYRNGIRIRVHTRVRLLQSK